MEPVRRLSIPTIGDYYEIIEAPSPTSAANSKDPIIFGILGSSTYYSINYITDLMSTATQTWGKPTKIILTPQGNSTAYIEAWADANAVDVHHVELEWHKHGPRACSLANQRIEREATHFLMIRSPRARSDRLLQKAEAFAKARKRPRETFVLNGLDDHKAAMIDYYECKAQTAPTTATAPVPAPSDIRSFFR